MIDGKRREPQKIFKRGIFYGREREMTRERDDDEMKEDTISC
jgi:hypothetical protein